MIETMTGARGTYALAHAHGGVAIIYPDGTQVTHTLYLTARAIVRALIARDGI